MQAGGNPANDGFKGNAAHHEKGKNERSGPLGDIVVSNHLGFLDVPVLLSIYPAVFMIKDEIGRLQKKLVRAKLNQLHSILRPNVKDFVNEFSTAIKAVRNH